MNLIKRMIVLSVLFIVTSCAEETTSYIAVNQLGYLSYKTKTATVVSNEKMFSLFSVEKGKIILTKPLSQGQYWAQSGEEVKTADFTEVTETGKYKIIVGNDSSSLFEISKNIFTSVAKASLKTFYYQRASVELPVKYAGIWQRKAGLPDTSVIIHPSAATNKRPAGTKVSAPGGWFDAGDYNKYIVSSGITTYTLILLYDLYHDYFKSISLNIPESNNNLPDILDEILWNVRWMMKMQDPNDGGVYHKLTSKHFQPYIMPAEVKAERMIVGKSTSAALDFSAVFSHLSVVIRKYHNDYLPLSDSCLIMAKRAWDWAIKNPNVHFKNPEEIETGEYSDNKLNDNFFWAGLELYFATGDKSYLKNINDLSNMVLDSLYWAQVGNLGILTALTGEENLKNSIEGIDIIENVFKQNVENIYQNNIESPYKISLGVFKWGSNANLLNETVMLLAAYEIYNNSKYLKAAITNTDYILGRNPLNISYVTGYGDKYPMHIHHRISEADGVTEPIPGFVVGGPNPYYLIDCGKEKYPSLLPAKCYLDDVESYSTNEVAINWNAPLAFVLFSLDYYSNL